MQRLPKNQLNVLSVVFVIGSYILLSLALIRYREHAGYREILLQSPSFTTATILDKYVSLRIGRKGVGTDRYYVIYRYSVDGKNYQMRQEVSSKQRFQQIIPTTQEPVVYVASNPTTVGLANYPLPGNPFLSDVLVYSAASIIFTALAVKTFFPRQRRKNKTNVIFKIYDSKAKAKENK